MQTSMYQASVPVFVRMLGNLAAILEKAAAHAEARKIDPAALLNARLYPDMFPLVKQVQIATDAATGGIARLAGAEVPSYESKEASFPEIIARVRKAIADVQQHTAGADRRLRGQDHLLEDAQQREEHAGHALPHESRAAERLFSRHHCVQHPAAQRGGAGEAGLPRKIAGSARQLGCNGDALHRLLAHRPHASDEPCRHHKPPSIEKLHERSRSATRPEAMTTR